MRPQSLPAPGGGMPLVQAPASKKSGFVPTIGGIKSGVKKRITRKIQRAAERRLKEMYSNKIKFMIAADRMAPMFVRTAMHDVVDVIWEGLCIEVVRTFEKMIENIDGETNNRALPAPSPRSGPTPSAPRSSICVSPTSTWRFVT